MRRQNIGNENGEADCVFFDVVRWEHLDSRGDSLRRYM